MAHLNTVPPPQAEAREPRAQQNELRAIFTPLDRDGSGSVSWTEFLAAAACCSVCHLKPKVHGAFEFMCETGTHRLSARDIERVFGKEHKALWSEHVRLQIAS